MDAAAGFVLGALGSVSAGLAYYLRVYLPRAISERTRDSMRAFSRAVELRFPNHEGLTARVVPLSLAVAQELELGPNHLLNLELAAQLRDIGLCAVPYRLINVKPQIKWTDEDRTAYFEHGDIGASMLEEVPSLAHLAPIVREHHTPYDGSGGPLRPRGDLIPIESRILNVVSAFVWFDRWQGEMLARTWLEQGEGIDYDPRVVRALTEVLTSSRGAELAIPMVTAAR